MVTTAADYEKAIETRMAGRERVDRLAQRPDGQGRSSGMPYAEKREAAEAGTL